MIEQASLQKVEIESPKNFFDNEEDEDLSH